MIRRDRDNKASRPKHSQDPQRADQPALPCIGCGYDLTGIVDHAAGEVCPECAAPIADSVEFHRLHANDPARYGGRKYVARLQYSSAAMALYAPFAVLAFLLVGVLTGASGPATGGDLIAFGFYFIFGPIMAIAVGIPAILVFMSSRPAAFEQPRVRALRRAVRGTLAVSLLLMLLVPVGIFVQGLEVITFRLLLPALAVAMTVVTIGVCFYYLRIAEEFRMRFISIARFASFVGVWAAVLASADALLTMFYLAQMDIWARCMAILHAALAVMFILLLLRLLQVRSSTPAADQ